MPLCHRVLSRQSKFLIFYMHLIELYVTKHKNYITRELYFNPCLNLHVFISYTYFKITWMSLSIFIVYFLYLLVEPGTHQCREDVNEEGCRHLIFTTKYQLQLLSQTRGWYMFMDGMFKVI